MTDDIQAPAATSDPRTPSSPGKASPVPDELTEQLQRGQPITDRDGCPHCPHPWHGLFCRPYSDTPTRMCWCVSSFPGRVA